MKLDKLNRWLTLTANVSVVAGIIFLALEVRQNSESVRASTTQALEQGVSDVMYSWTSSVHHAVIMDKAMRDFAALSEEEQIFAIFCVRRLYLHMDAYFWAHKQGLLPIELWEREERVMAYWVNLPIGRSVWKDIGLSDSFTQHVQTTLISD